MDVALDGRLATCGQPRRRDELFPDEAAHAASVIHAEVKLVSVRGLGRPVSRDTVLASPMTAS